MWYLVIYLTLAGGNNGTIVQGPYMTQDACEMAQIQMAVRINANSVCQLRI
jgi:hypothetical protein